MNNDELIRRAATALHARLLDDGRTYVADVACALVAQNGEVFTGTCIGSHLGLCAEQSAVSNMVSKTEPKVRKIVAVWRNEQGELHVLPPCGRCREFLRRMSSDNLEAEVILGKGHATKLKDLLPFYGWHAEKV